LNEHAHLIGVAMTGVSRSIYKKGIVDTEDPNLARHLAVLRDRAGSALPAFEAIVQESGVRSFETQIVDDEAGGGLSLQSRYCDLVVIGQTDPQERSPDARPDFPQYVVMNSVGPLLIAPRVGHFEYIDNRILIAWDGSKEAARAVRNALPLLRRAGAIDVVVFNLTDLHGLFGAQPGSDIALYLARHGINVEVTHQTTNQEIGAALLKFATDLHDDLIVMGGYSHSPFREMMLGGVTTTVLRTMTIPVLMSH
jgi:nucleotide-binding universal stress UspA family protein